jgi:hypothetical protein
MAKKSKELAVVNNFEVALINTNDLQDEMAGLTISFDRVKIPSGGSTAFEVPGDDPDSPDIVKEIVGVIVDHHPVNGYWQDKYAGGKQPPDCSSMDGITGYTRAGEIAQCTECPFNAWGSGDGNSKACKNMHRIYIQRSGESLPLLLTLPPTSIRNFSDYIVKRLLSKGRKSSTVITKISLRKEQSKDNIQYSQAQFAVSSELPEKIAKDIAARIPSIKAITRKIEVQTVDYDVPVEEEGEKEDLPF